MMRSNGSLFLNTSRFVNNSADRNLVPVRINNFGIKSNWVLFLSKFWHILQWRKISSSMKTKENVKADNIHSFRFYHCDTILRWCCRKMVEIVICNVFVEWKWRSIKHTREKNDLYFLPELSSNMVIVICWCWLYLFKHTVGIECAALLVDTECLSANISIHCLH